MCAHPSSRLHRPGSSTLHSTSASCAYGPGRARSSRVAARRCHGWMTYEEGLHQERGPFVACTNSRAILATERKGALTGHAYLWLTEFCNCDLLLLSFLNGSASIDCGRDIVAKNTTNAAIRHIREELRLAGYASIYTLQHKLARTSHATVLLRTIVVMQACSRNLHPGEATIKLHKARQDCVKEQGIWGPGDHCSVRLLAARPTATKLAAS